MLFNTLRRAVRPCLAQARRLQSGAPPRGDGGAGGGGRIALISDNLINQGMIFLDGGLSNGDGSAGKPGVLFTGPKTVDSPSALSVTDGNLIFDTGGSWSHSSGLSGKGTITTHDFQANGRRWGYSVCTFSFTSS